MTDCSFCRGFRQGYFRPLDCTDPTYLGVLLRCPMCLDTDSAQPGGGTDSEPTVSGAGVPSGRVRRLALIGSDGMAVGSLGALTPSGSAAARSGGAG